MVIHTVCFQAKPYVDGKNKWEVIEEIKRLLETLPGKIPAIRAQEVAVSDKGKFDVVLVSLFGSQQELDDYDKNPKHLEVKDAIAKITLDWSVVDYPVG